MKIIGDMKKIVKKKKAFTLVELMGVLVIIGVLTVILVPVINNMIKENKQKMYNKQLDSIKLAAKNFVSDNVFLLPTNDGEIVYINLNQLKRMGYIDDVIINPLTKEEISNCTLIEITKVEGGYEYQIDENTIESDDCNLNNESTVSISSPSRNYITKGMTSSYIIIVGTTDEIFSGYTLDESKIELVGEPKVDVKYSIIGENGIYKVTLIGGNTEGEISFKLNSDAILNESGNNTVGEGIISQAIIVDNTAPVITFTNNGSSWTNNANTIINVNDSKSGGNTSTYKYIFSNVVGAEPINNFSTDVEVSHTSGNGMYYLIAKACDNVGNCATETSNYFQMDTTSPSIPNVNLVYEDNNQSYNQSWTNRNVKQVQSSTDAGVGDIYYQYSHNNSTWDNMPTNWVISWDGSWTFYVRACDSLGNCSASAPSYWIGIDKTSPNVPNINLVYEDNNQSYNQSWTNKNVKQVQSSTDAGVGNIYYQYSHDNSTWDNMPTNWVISWNGSWTFYVRACDSLGNCSASAPSYWIGIDKTPPSFNSCTWHTNYTYNDRVYRYALVCQYSEDVYRRYGHCYNIASNPNYSSGCVAKSLEDRFAASSYHWIGSGENLGFETRINSGDTISIKLEIKDQAGNTASNTYTYTQP